MTVTTIRGAAGGNLLRYLAAVGVFKAVSRQVDSRATAHFVGTDFEIDSTVDDLAHWLTSGYTPMPLFSPWNEGSGFGAKDKAPKEHIARIIAADDRRFDDFVATFRICEPFAADFRAEGSSKDKAPLVLRLRNNCPPRMVEWIDTAVVVLGDGELAFPPIVGTGGNDGRLDFSTKYHEAISKLITTTPKDLRRSEILAQKFVADDRTGLSKGAPGQFDPGAAGTPNTSPFGSSDGIINGWEYAMMMEGVTMFASSPARRFSMDAPQAVKALNSSARVAMTFSTFGSDLGMAAGSPSEESRGELWTPLWQDPVRLRVLQELFREGRAVWNGKTVVQSPDMYCAVRSGGTSDGFSSFDRFTFSRRNGLAFSAIRADSVRPRKSNPLLRLAAVTEDWPRRVARGSEVPATIARHTRAYENARFRLATDSGTSQIRALRTMLASLTLAELAVGRSTTTRDGHSPRRCPGADVLLDIMRSEETIRDTLTSDIAFRLGLGLASVRTPRDSSVPRGRGLRELLLPISVSAGAQIWTDSAIVPGIGFKPLESLFTEALRWYTQFRESNIDAPTPSWIGSTGPRTGVRVSCHDLSRWIADRRLDEDVLQWTLALMALDWTGIDYKLPTPTNGPLDPTFAVFAFLRNGVRPPAHTVSDSLNDERGGVALTPEVVSTLSAHHKSTALDHARRRLRQVGWGTADSDFIGRTASSGGHRIAAALFPNSFLGSEHEHFVYPLRPAPSDNIHDA